MMKRSPKPKSQIPGQTHEDVQDTAAGCRERAAADLARASLACNLNGRLRLESSALSFMNRALLIERPDDRPDARRLAAKAEWEEEKDTQQQKQAPDQPLAAAPNSERS